MVKHLSTRAQICGRGYGCHGGHSAVEQASYIARVKMYCEYDGYTYYPKYSEDLVHSEVMLPDNAPKEYMDPSVLWNSVENNEKNSNAQLARTYRVELPNEWSYQLAREVMRGYIKENFVDEGMCVQFAIHDSENKNTGQRNLHCHMLLTLRSIDEDGKWMPKQRKIYIKDENGERIPIIDKKTGLQKVDKQNRKQWKCETVATNNWSSRENAYKWRKNFADTINNVNEALHIDVHWEHRSFKEQGLDIVPQVHLGEKASALERAGVRTEKGDLNREIIEHNKLILKATETIKQTQIALDKLKESTKSLVGELFELIDKVCIRNKRLSLPLKREFVGKISNRQDLQNKEYMLTFLADEKLTTFDELSKFRDTNMEIYEKLKEDRLSLAGKIDDLREKLRLYSEYEPYKKNNEERYNLWGWMRKRYESNHIAELGTYDFYHNKLKAMLKPGEKITPMKWRSELRTYEGRYDSTQDDYANAVINLAKVEVLEYNKKDLERMLKNESHSKNKTLEKSKKRDENLL